MFNLNGFFVHKVVWILKDTVGQNKPLKYVF